MSRKGPIDIDELTQKLKLHLAQDLQKLGRPRKCRCCGQTVVASRGHRKLAHLGRQLERLLRGKI